MEGITLSNGEEFNIGRFEDNMSIGYQIVNKITGRLFPSTVPFEAYTERAAFEKITTVTKFMEDEHKIFIDTDEYELVEVFEKDFDSGFHIIMNEDDWHEIKK